MQLIYLKKLYILYTINIHMLWSKNQTIIYYYPIACQCIFSRRCVDPFEGRVMQSLFSENVYENERVGSYRGYALENFVISTNA